jgi:hypothetical protein
VPGAQTINEDTTLTFGAGKLISIADVDANGSDLKVTLAVANGTLNVVDAAGLGIVGDNSGNVTLTGTVAEINAGLNGMIFTPTGNFNGSTELTVTTDDQGFTGSGGPLTDVDKITINVTAVNDAPVITSDGGNPIANIDAAENQTAVTTVTATDVDAGTTLTFSIIGGADQLLFDITSGGVLTFKDAPDFETRRISALTASTT